MQGPRRRHGFAADIAGRRWRCARRLRRRQRKRRRKRLDAAACEKSPALLPVFPHTAAPRSSPACPATSKLCPSQPPSVNFLSLIALPGAPFDWGQSQRSRHGQPILPDAAAHIVQIRPLGHLPHAGALHAAPPRPGGSSCMANDRCLLVVTSMPALWPATRLSTSPATKKPRFAGTRHSLPQLTRAPR